MDLDKLERLASLRNTGAITEAEFESEKAKLLLQSQDYEPSYCDEGPPRRTGKIIAAAVAVLLVGGAAAQYATDQIGSNEILPASLPTPAASRAETETAKPQVSRSSARMTTPKPALFFVGESDQTGIEAVRAHTSKSVIAGHYSLAEVPCGTGCLSDYLVDRNTGGVFGLPITKGMDEGSMMFWTVRGSATSDVITIIYGPATGLDEDHPCEQSQFRIVGTKFIPVGGTVQLPKCPHS